MLLTPKNKICTFLCIILLFSCEKTEKLQSLEEKKVKLNALREKSTELVLQIKKLEKEINALSSEDSKQKLKKITATILQIETFEHYIESQGNVDSEQNVQVVPQLGGVILKKYVEEGQKVSKGQVLVEIDAENIRRNMAEIKTRLTLASTIYDRQKNLWEQKIGSEVQYLQAKNEKEVLHKTLETLESQLEKAYVKSPINGILDEFFTNPGETASPQFALARVVNLSRVKVTAEVSESYIPNVHKGDTVWVRFTELGLEESVPIKQIGRFINPANRTFKIQIQVNNQQGWLRPNTLAVVKIRDFVLKHALTIPSHLIQKSTDGKLFVYTVVQQNNNHIICKVIIETSKSYQGKTVVTKGLTAGDRLVVEGYNEVINKELVNLTDHPNSL